jgi:hypothetical protein
MSNNPSRLIVENNMAERRGYENREIIKLRKTCLGSEKDQIVLIVRIISPGQ